MNTADEEQGVKLSSNVASYSAVQPCEIMYAALLAVVAPLLLVDNLHPCITQLQCL